MKKKKFIVFITAVIMTLSFITTQADSPITIKVDSVTASSQNTVSVPIRISGNTGICGATITVGYDSRLKLTKIDNGDAFTNLDMTKPGDLKANPFNLVWDGIEADNSNGTIATLVFEKPKESGVYNISVSYENGDIVDENLSPLEVAAENGSITVPEVTVPSAKPIVSVGNVTAQIGNQIKVPISIKGNTGICGATLSVLYDAGLILTDISQGTALTTLAMTKPGNLSANPFNLIWDGLEADNSNGVIAELTFMVPQNAGEYNIYLNYDEGDIVDGNLNPIFVTTEQGNVKVKSEPVTDISVTINDEVVTVPNDNPNSTVIIAQYTNDNTLISAETRLVSEGDIIITGLINAAYAKIMLWDSIHGMKPLYNAQTVNIKN